VQTTFYVATTGSDTNSGSQAAPWRTLQHAGDVALAGSDVVVLPGTYQGFRPWHSGTATAPIRFLAQPGVVVTTPGSSNSNSDNIWVRDVDYIVIDGFESRNAPRAGVAVQGEPEANATGVAVRNCYCHDNGRWGIFTGFARDLLIEGNETSTSVAEHGIYVSNSGDRPVVRRNHAHHNHASGIQLNADPAEQGPDPSDPQGDGIIEGALIEDNVIHDNGVAGGAAINLASVRSSVIRNNLLYSNLATGIAGWDDGDGNQYGTRDNVIVGNTIVQPSNGRFAIGLKDGSINNQVFDNILLHAGTRGSLEVDPSSQPGLHSDYNVVVNVFSNDSVFLSLAQWRALGFDAHSLISTAAALFTNAAANDYHLTSGSPAVDAGIGRAELGTDLDGRTRPLGAATDIGAYEQPSSAGLAGQIRYYANSLPVSTVSVRLDGQAIVSSLSDATGGFSFPGLASASWQLSATKLGDAGAGISALDATYALQAAVGQRTLTSWQQLACDVTGNGTVSALDASRILQYKVGIISRLPAAETCASDWLFVPTPMAVPNQQIISPALATGTCRNGAITYNPLTNTAAQQDFSAVLLGDCTGNWQPSSGGAVASGTKGLATPATVHLSSARTGRNSRFARVALRMGEPFFAFDMEVRYDAAHWRPLGTQRPRLRGPRTALLAANEPTQGIIAIALASHQPLPSGTTLWLSFERVDPQASAPAVRDQAVWVSAATVDEDP
jgi:parallel beta helix pectate lyase-like protein